MKTQIMSPALPHTSVEIVIGGANCTAWFLGHMKNAF